jgi:DNA/RNA-binding domain of Phe-tRNA-synthetase-like protein
MNGAEFSDKDARVSPASLILSKSEDLAEIPMRWKVYRNLRIKKRDSRVEKWVKEHVREFRSQWKDALPPGMPDLNGYVTLHDRFAEEKGIPSSCEGLIGLVRKNGSIPRINPFVDLYNLVSLLTGVSIGAHDIRNISGQPKLMVLSRDVSFAPIGGRGTETAKQGEYAYVDDAGVICRMDIKQCDRTKITPQTQNALVIFQGYPNLSSSILAESIRRLDEALAQFQVLP